MTMDRGRKSALRQLAKELRVEVGAASSDPFDVFALAELYGLDVVQMSQLDCAGAVQFFGEAGYQRFSGAQVPVSRFGSCIVVNDLHTIERQRSTLGHEVAHSICEHPHEARLVDSAGCRVADRVLEEEATFLSGELLLPTDAARMLAIKGVAAEVVATQYQISVEMARWRLNISGGHQIRRRRAQ